MNVLSLFDGMSCGMLALQRAGIKVDQYYASEIDKYAIQISKKNFPEIVQLGDVKKWREWNLPHIDLVIGGSPCQGFSISTSGKGLNFDDPRSKLFFEFVDIVKHYNPKYFLLENVKMKKGWRDIITGYLAVEPILINSALVSAQNRERYYWTNIPNIQQPSDKKIFLKDIIESGDVDMEKSYVIDANYFKGGSIKKIYNKSSERFELDKTYQSTRRLMVMDGVVNGAAVRNQVTKRGVEEQLNIRKDEKSNCVVPSFTDRLNLCCIQVGEADVNGHDVLKRVYSVEGKSPTLNTMSGGNREPKILTSETTWRKLTPRECERLQTVPDGFTEGVSNSQRYKMLGNGWTVDVVAHILKHLPDKHKL